MIADELFTDEVLRRLLERHREPASEWDWPAAPIRERHLILGSSSEERWAARRLAWLGYLDAAREVGLLDDEHRARLTSVNDDDFRSAMSECFAASFFRQRGGTVVPRPPGAGSKVLDLRVSVDGASFNVEVKAPYVPRDSNVVAGGDHAALRGALEDAYRQLPASAANLVVLVPLLRVAVCDHRNQLERLIGTRVFHVPVRLDGEDDDEDPEVRPGFAPNGKLAAQHPAPDGTRSTHLRRVSAVMALEERYEDGAVRPVATVVHNPYAKAPLDPALFSYAWQFAPAGPDTMAWRPPG